MVRAGLEAGGAALVNAACVEASAKPMLVRVEALKTKLEAGNPDLQLRTSKESRYPARSPVRFGSSRPH